METNEVRLERATAEGVLGEYTHEVLIGDEDFVIIYGPNGVGKTRFLEIIHALSNLDGNSLMALPFDEAKLEYSDGASLLARRRNVVRKSRHADGAVDYAISYQLQRQGFKPLEWEHEDDELMEFIRRHPRYAQVSENQWEDKSEGEQYSLEDLRARLGAGPRFKNLRTDETPSAAREFVALVPSFLIEAQRLRTEPVISSEMGLDYRRPREARISRSRIREQARTLKDLLTQAQTDHSLVAQSLDRTFPHRVLKAAEEDISLDPKIIRDRYDVQNEFRGRLGRVAPVSLDDEFSLPDRELAKWELTLLNQYLEDADKKLAPFRGLLEKVELLEKIVNDRLLRKSLQVSDTRGLSIAHESTGQEIDLESLSSGEQHEVILMIDLLFNVPRGAVVLIDEPEISLHVAWQLAFIPDVRKIAKLSGFRFIVATHSPQIINDSWDQARRLGPSEERFD
jgi:predicted ATP-binding protein involved in virulence